MPVSKINNPSSGSGEECYLNTKGNRRLGDHNQNTLNLNPEALDSFAKTLHPLQPPHPIQGKNMLHTNTQAASSALCSISVNVTERERGVERESGQI